MPSAAEAHRAITTGQRRGPGASLARAALWWAQWPYALAVGWRNRRFDRNPQRAIRVSVPVICVGNLSVGGTGKTVCVEAVARFFREDNVSVVILSRGYGSPDGGPNDEALLLEDNLPDVPHLQGVDRVALAQTAIEELEPEMILLDDGFQHRRLHRDLDLVLVDATEPLASDHLLPRGRLREPVSALKRAGLVILTHCDLVPDEHSQAQREWIQQRFPELPVVRACHHPRELFNAQGETLPPHWLEGQRIAAFCGIAQPDTFRQTLENLGATLNEFRSFPDHHNYSRDDVEELQRWAEQLPAGTAILTTQKDWVKLRVNNLGSSPLWALRIELTWRDGEERFQAALRAVVREPQPDRLEEECES